MDYTIYCHTSPSGKRYVGQTCQGMMRRWRRHVLGQSAGTALHAAILKYGADRFTHDVLETVGSRADANTAETRWILALGCLAPHGYNLRLGGDARDTHPTTLEKMSVFHRERWADMPTERRATLIAALVAAYTPEMRSAAGKRRWEAMSPEERHASASRRGSGVSAEKQAAKGRATWAGKTPDQRTEMARKSWATRRAKAALDATPTDVQG